MGGWKQKSGWIQILPASCVPFTFPFLSQLSVCLIVSRVRAYLTTDQQHGIPCFLKRGPLPDWPVWTREQMISGGAAEREDREDEAERDKPDGTQPAPDNRERAPSGALSPEHASDKGDEAPLSLMETRSPSNDKGVPSQPEHTNSLQITTMHSLSETTIVFPETDNSSSTLPSLEKGAEDKNEDEEGSKIPPPLFKRNPEDNDEGHWGQFNEPATQAKISAIKAATKGGMAAKEISSSFTGGMTKPKQKDQTGSWVQQKAQDKSTAPKIRRNKSALEKTTLFPLGSKPFNYGQKNDSDESQLLALGQVIAQQDKFESDKSTSVAAEICGDNDSLPDNPDEDWEFPDGTSPLSLLGGNDSGADDVDYSSEKSETGSVKALGDKNTEPDNSFSDEQGDKSIAPQRQIIAEKKPVLTQQVIMDLVASQASSKRTLSAAGWERNKEEYGQLLDGYQSPTSRNVQVDVGLATLMIISAVAENTNRINLAAQNEQREMMIKQAEMHRESLEKEFTSGLERIRAEHEKAISEQKRFREEYAHSCTLENGDKTLQNVGDNQGMAIVTFQMSVLQRQAERAQQELKEFKENHERELRHEKEMIIAQGKIIEEERQKNNKLKEELRIFEESILKGMMISGSKMETKSHKDSPESPKHKRVKIDEEGSSDNVSSQEIIGIKQEVPQSDNTDLKIVPIFIDENDKVHYETTAYTTSTRDKSNILIAKKDQKAIRSESSGEAKTKELCAHLIKHQPRLATQEEIRISLEAWRAMLRSTRDYYPDKHQTNKQHLINLKVLMGARASYHKSVHSNPIAKEQWKHQEYGPIHRQYFIPLEYMDPHEFFQKFQENDDKQLVYWKRCCSMYEYYVMLSEDNPEFKPKGPPVNTRDNPNPRDYRPLKTKNVAHNPFASSDKAPSDKWGKGLMSSAQGSSSVNAWKDQKNGLMGETSPRTPAIRSAPLSDKIRFEEQKISSFSYEQQEASERTHRHRTNMTRNNAPVPGSESESSQEDEDSLFDDKLLPPEKFRIMKLRKEIKRIKGGVVYPTGYEKDRDRAIKDAEECRLLGKPVPPYLTGVKIPWSSGMGQANIHYDNHQVSRREDKIAKIRRLNAEHCQQEHIANMSSITRKGGPGGQVQS